MELASLNDDCVRAVFEYLPSEQLFAIALSKSLKKKRFYTAAMDVLLKCRVPFRIRSAICEMPNSSSFGASRPTDRLFYARLEDRNGKHIAIIKSAILFASSPLCQEVRGLELAVDLLRTDDTETNFWAVFIFPLPTLTSLWIRMLDKQRNVRCCLPDAKSNSRLRELLEIVRPSLPTIQSFTLLGEPVMLPGQMDFVHSMLCDMPELSSLTLPTYFLKFLASRNHGCFRANVRELLLYVNHASKVWSQPGEWSCTTALGLVWQAGFHELSHLSFDCRSVECKTGGNDNGGHNCVGSVASLGQLERLQKLTLDVNLDEAQLSNSTAQVAIPEVHVTLRQSSSTLLTVLFKRLINPAIVRISLTYPSCSDPTIINHLRPMFNQPSFHSELLAFAVTTTHRPIQLPPLLTSYSVLLADLPICLKLRSVDLTAISFNLTGYPSERADASFCGYWQIGPIVKALVSNLCLRKVKMSASIDSTTALESCLPPDCGIIDLIEKPRATYSRYFVYQPDTYWLPVKVVIGCQREGFQRAFVEHFAETLFLTISNSNLQ